MAKDIPDTIMGLPVVTNENLTMDKIKLGRFDSYILWQCSCGANNNFSDDAYCHKCGAPYLGSLPEPPEEQ